MLLKHQSGISSGCNTVASVPASQAGYEGSIPFTRSIVLCIFAALFISGCATTPTTPYISETKYAPAGGTYYTVRAGDTLWRISRLYDVDIKSLVKANSLEDTNIISKGQKLYIPGTHRIEKVSRATGINDSFIWPVSGNVIAFFGSKADRVKNKGIDIKAGQGSYVRASRAGKVVFCDDKLKGFGKTIIVDHEDGYQTVYAYNSEILVKPGDAVTQSTAIARVGRTGRAKEDSLHFEIRKGGEPENPFYYLTR